MYICDVGCYFLPKYFLDFLILVKFVVLSSFTQFFDSSIILCVIVFHYLSRHLYGLIINTVTKYNLPDVDNYYQLNLINLLSLIVRVPLIPQNPTNHPKVQYQKWIPCICNVYCKRLLSLHTHQGWAVEVWPEGLGYRPVSKVALLCGALDVDELPTVLPGRALCRALVLAVLLRIWQKTGNFKLYIGYK